MADAAVAAAQWVVGKALAPLADGVLEAWYGSSNLGPNIQELNNQLLYVQAMLEQAARKELGQRATEKLMQKLRDLAHNAEDLLDELDYFRIHDELHGTYEAADQHGKGCLCNLALNARHTAKALGKQLASFCACCFGGNAQEAPKLEFNRADFSRRITDTVEQLKLMRPEVNNILKDCQDRTTQIAQQRRPFTKGRIGDQKKLYGRDLVRDSIVHDITKGQYCDKGLTVLPVVGLPGMGKTTLAQHIFHNQQVKDHFSVRIWVCVSLNFNLDNIIQQIVKDTTKVEGEKENSKPEELIEERLKSKRFILVLDDIWPFSNEDDWNDLLCTLNQSQEKGCMILVTTRFQEVAQKVQATDHSIELVGLEPRDFRELFYAFAFGDGQCPRDDRQLLDIGDKIMGKLMGCPLAANTVGSLLRTNHSLAHWRRILNSKQWAKETNGIMSALKLSYDFLPFDLQQCFSYSALFPEDYSFESRELISLWIGLDILKPCGENPTFEGIGLSILNELVIRGFFKEEETYRGLRYVMHDLLHELALKVASHDCLSFHLSDVGSLEIKPSTRHLSISIEKFGEYNAVSAENLKSVLTELKVEHLQTLMLFGDMDEGFANIFGDFFGEANALRVLYLPEMEYPVESILHNFSGLVHLRFLCLGTWSSEVHLPLSISKLYHLRVLDLKEWRYSGDFPEDMSNLAKLCHYYTPRDDELHSDICNVGKLKLLEKLKVFRVNKKSEGFEPKQLEALTKLWELGICNLEKICTKEEATQAKLIEKSCLRRLTLDWDSKQSIVEPSMEAVVLESLQPHGDLQVLCIRGHGGTSCPTWLGDELDLRELRLEDMARLKELIIGNSFYMLIKLELIGLASFEKWVYPAELESSDHIVSTDCFPKLQELEITNCPEFSTPISFTGSLRRVKLANVKLLKKFDYYKSADRVELEIEGHGDLHSLDQVLVFSKETCLEKLVLRRCPPLLLKHLRILTSLKKLFVRNSGCLVGPLGERGDVEWQLPVEYIKIEFLNGNTGKELTELLPHLPKLSKLEIFMCENIRELVVGVDLQRTTSATSEMEEDEIIAAEEEDGDDGVLLFPAHLCDSLRELKLSYCSELVLVHPPTPVPGEGWLQALRSLQRLRIAESPKFLSAYSFSYRSGPNLFPSSLQFLELRWGVEGMGTLEPLSNLSSLTELVLRSCGEDLKCRGLQSLLTTGGQLNKLKVWHSPGFFAGWDLDPRRALEDVDGGEVQQTQLVSSTLQELCTDDIAGLLAAPICSFLSSSLTKLELSGWSTRQMERFSKEQEDALEWLSSLQQLEFASFNKLQQLPARICNLTRLKKLIILFCPAVSSLPNDGLPESLQELNVKFCENEELKQQCRGLVGTIPVIQLEKYPPYGN